MDANVIDAWRLRDAQFEHAFRHQPIEGSASLIRRVLSLISSRVSEPMVAADLTAYRDHLMHGLEIGTLPVPGSMASPAKLSEIADPERDARNPGPGGWVLQGVAASRGFMKLLLDFRAGKIPFEVPAEQPAE